MSNFFINFPSIDYKFGNESTADKFQNIAIYADIIDQIKDENSVYTDINLIENERPDQTSFRLYGTANYHWTFYLLNDKIREQGWPITRANVLEKAKKDYPNTVITTRSSLGDVKGFFKTSDVITGRSSGATATIIHRYLDLGQLVITNINNGPFQASELLEVTGTTNTIVINSITQEHLSVHHYEDASKVIQDIDPTLAPPAEYTPITYLDRLHTQNNNLRQIRVFKPDLIQTVVDSFNEAVSS